MYITNSPIKKSPIKCWVRWLYIKIISAALFIACPFWLLAQKNIASFHSNSAAQFGYGIKVLAEFGKKKPNIFVWRAGLSAGLGAFLGNNWCYPALNTDILFYQGGIGSRWPGYSARKELDMEINVSYSVTAGGQNRMKEDHSLRPGLRNYPLYYFSNFTHPALQNPFNWSASFGGNSIFHFGLRKKTLFQMVGFLNIHLDRFQASYTNDGPPFFPPFGDKFDRYHTGGGFITFHGDDSWIVNLVEVGFNKFTGYSKNAYELSNRIGNGYIYHKDETQQYYNKNRIYINIANTAKGYGGAFNFYNNPNLDVQHKIHTNSFYTLHMVPYKPHNSISIETNFQQLKLGLQ